MGFGKKYNKFNELTVKIEFLKIAKEISKSSFLLIKWGFFDVSQ